MSAGVHPSTGALVLTHPEVDPSPPTVAGRLQSALGPYPCSDEVNRCIEEVRDLEADNDRRRMLAQDDHVLRMSVARRLRRARRAGEALEDAVDEAIELLEGRCGPWGAVR
ncbi:MAG: hypothetical protein GWN84_20775 [Gammaproteobacteria bacterium]|nr:hypothetical protein [Gammaproteobacteria bacterium]NIR85195.1 hypothetical protein [Gammaproteobacteria bacterium]NIU06245.1 hypothetical protein [Gammaproteobacteria bacterium]NIX87518.1 hypothetical protein [Gammaproteobacteria bacterium]